MNPIYLDVSELPAPEPFQKIMAALTELKTDGYLKVVHRKEPLLLYQPLSQLGFSCHVQAGQKFPFEIFIWFKDQAAPTELIHPNLVQNTSSTKKSGDC